MLILVHYLVTKKSTQASIILAIGMLGLSKKNFLPKANHVVTNTPSQNVPDITVFFYFFLHISEWLDCLA